MSIRVMNDVWAHPPVGGSALLVLLALADNADEERRTGWPSIPTIARKTRLSASTVHRAIEQLERAGVVVRTFREGRSTLYRITPLSEWQGSQSDTPVTGDTPTPVTGDTPPLSPVTPEPSRNRHQEPSEVLPPPDGDGETADGQGSLIPFPKPGTSTKRSREVDALWDAVMFVCEVDVGAIPRSARGGYNAAVRDLREVGALPAEVVRRAAIFRATYPGARLTPTALARRWAECGEYVAAAPAQRLRQAAEQQQLAARLAALDAEEER